MRGPSPHPATGDPATLPTLIAIGGQLIHRQHMFYRGVDNNIYHVWWDGQLLNWETWTSDSQAAGNPATLFFDQQHVFYRGNDNNIHHVWWDFDSKQLQRDQWSA